MRIDIPEIVLAGDVYMNEGSKIGPRKISDYELVYFPIGTSTTYTAQHKTFTLDEPCFILTRPAEEHSYSFDNTEPTRHIFFHFGCNTEQDGFFLGMLQEATCIKAVPPHIAVLIGNILLLMGSDKLRWKERCNHMLYMILEELACTYSELSNNGIKPDETASPNIPEQLTEALQYIEQNLHKPINIADMAKKVGWSHGHLTRQFVQLFNMPPQMAILHRRVDLACQYLIGGKWSIKQIAFAVGFKDTLYFYRCFNKIKGMTASSYREMYGNDTRIVYFKSFDESHLAHNRSRWISF